MRTHSGLARLVECLDKHAPLRTIRICTNNAHNPWYDEDIEEARLKRKAADKKKAAFIIRRTDKTCQLDPLPDNILRKCIPNNAPNPWYDEDIEEARLKRKAAEKTWRHSKLEIHRQIYVAARNECTSLISKRKTEYYRDKLEHACNKTMFGLVKTLSGKQHQRQQPNFLQNDKGCDMFSEYLTNKTAKLVLNMQCQSESL